VQPQWRAAPLEQVILTEWDGEYVVYHRPSGKTHFLNVPGVTLLSDILMDTSSLEKSAQSLAHSLGIEADAKFLEHVEALLLRFEELGLTERVQVDDVW
jgi:PqqD family protein of HPr-rel-A system